MATRKRRSADEAKSDILDVAERRLARAWSRRTQCRRRGPGSRYVSCDAHSSLRQHGRHASGADQPDDQPAAAGCDRRASLRADARRRKFSCVICFPPCRAAGMRSCWRGWRSARNRWPLRASFRRSVCVVFRTHSRARPAPSRTGSRRAGSASAGLSGRHLCHRLRNFRFDTRQCDRPRFRGRERIPGVARHAGAGSPASEPPGLSACCRYGHNGDALR